MGKDIWGFIECHRDYRDHEADSFWHATIDLDHLKVPRNYDAFGCLFGVCDSEQFVPVASVRGLPADVSNRVRDGHETTAGRSASWVSWAELKRVDWNEESAEPDAYVREYYRDQQGDWQSSSGTTPLLSDSSTSAGSRLISSPAWPGVTVKASGRQRLSATRWILVVKPPRERPRA
ncbi:hypothetical protein [Streptomyces sp. NPDC013489]|uniref:hypothetical protein n=1 Tax=Streptomyces sp. NPDC013489 TaxID=3155606 RepID=UPI0034108C7B